MRTRHLFLCILAWVSCLHLLTCTAALAQSPSSTEKLQNIRKLIVILGGLDIQKQGIHEEIGASRKKEVDKKDLQVLIDRLVPVYDKYLTDEEVSKMLRFYESPIGKRVAQAMPKMREESRRITLEWRQAHVKKGMDKRRGLIHAVAKGDTAAVKELLSSGANVNQQNSRGVTALMAAAYKGNVEVAKLLVENDADVNARTSKGMTPLMAAVQFGNKELVKFLLDKGADANMKDEMGLNAYQLAAMKNQHELMTLLKDKTTDRKSVRVSLVVSSPGKFKGCLAVMSRPSDSSKKITCLKSGQEVATIPSVPTNNGWTLIQYPKLGWVPSESLKQKLVSEPKVTPATKPRKSGASSILAKKAQPSVEPAPKKTQDMEDATGPADQPRIWWRH